MLICTIFNDDKSAHRSDYPVKCFKCFKKGLHNKALLMDMSMKETLVYYELSSLGSYKDGKLLVINPYKSTYSSDTFVMWTLSLEQCAKKVMSDSLGLLDFAIRLVNSVFNLPDGQVIFFEQFK